MNPAVVKPCHAQNFYDLCLFGCWLILLEIHYANAMLVVCCWNFDCHDLNVDYMMNHAVEPRNLLGLTVVCLLCEHHHECYAVVSLMFGFAWMNSV
jgi:hypothetical protein